MALFSLRRSQWIGVKGWESKREKKRTSLDVKEKQIILFPLITFRIGMAWMQRMLSNLYQSCHNNDLNHGVWISSCLLLYKLHDELLGENTTPVTLQPLITWWWPLSFTAPILLNPSMSRQEQINSNSTKNVLFGGSKLNKSARKTHSSLPVCNALLFFFTPSFPAGQVWGFISSILLSHRWETMCFIPLHCKSNLMLHAL